MARPKSVILSKEDKKTVIAELKNKIKSAKDNIKQLGGIRKEADKAFAAARKAHIAALKDNDKQTMAAVKESVSLSEQLAALTKAVTA